MPELPPKPEFILFRLNVRQRTGLGVSGQILLAAVGLYASGATWWALFLILCGSLWMGFCFWPEIRRVRMLPDENAGESAGPLLWAGLTSAMLAGVGVLRFVATPNDAPPAAVVRDPSPPRTFAASSSTTVPDSPARASLRRRVKVLAEDLDRFDREREDTAPRSHPGDAASVERAARFDDETASIFKRRFLNRVDEILDELRSYGVRDEIIDRIMKFPVPSHYGTIVERLPPLVDTVP